MDVFQGMWTYPDDNIAYGEFPVNKSRFSQSGTSIEERIARDEHGSTFYLANAFACVSILQCLWKNNNTA